MQVALARVWLGQGLLEKWTKYFMKLQTFDKLLKGQIFFGFIRSWTLSNLKLYILIPSSIIFYKDMTKIKMCQALNFLLYVGDSKLIMDYDYESSLLGNLGCSVHFSRGSWLGRSRTMHSEQSEDFQLNCLPAWLCLLLQLKVT